ncbi:MAG: hypothetical protein PHC62_11130 [Candidatus Izemoplasmatales bacterium]|nr:hypothetical protein [Candidatus Izemoplasmatales bacterium]
MKDALLNPIRIDTERDSFSQLFIGKGVGVSVNPKTGNLIQTNPLKVKKND